jgi:hypothetical protein
VAVPVVIVIAAVVAFVLVLRSGVTRPMDNLFGDQSLKSIVALIELHKVRHGEYPGALSELEFLGQWDRMPIEAASYCAADDRQSYYVEIRRGWMGRPDLKMPPEFWRGTGFRPGLGPCR